jgi:hypothetical protein
VLCADLLQRAFELVCEICGVSATSFHDALSVSSNDCRDIATRMVDTIEGLNASNAAKHPDLAGAASQPSVPSREYGPHSLHALEYKSALQSRYVATSESDPSTSEQDVDKAKNAMERCMLKAGFTRYAAQTI